MNPSLNDIVDLRLHALKDTEFQASCRRTLDEQGVLVLPNFITPTAINSIQAEGVQCQHLAYYTVNTHNIYLSPPDPQYSNNHPRNRDISSSKGCITHDQIPSESALHTVYNAALFQDFLCAVLGEAALFCYDDPLSSINLHFASEGQELGWHFDNSSFAITLLVQNPKSGGVFEYVKDVRDADSGEMSYEESEKILDGNFPTKSLAMEAGSLILFRGKNSMHRVTPTKGNQTRMLAVLAYNTKPGIALSKSARMTFYGRIG